MPRTREFGRLAANQVVEEAIAGMGVMMNGFMADGVATSGMHPKVSSAAGSRGTSRYSKTSFQSKFATVLVTRPRRRRN